MSRISRGFFVTVWPWAEQCFSIKNLRGHQIHARWEAEQHVLTGLKCAQNGIAFNLFLTEELAKKTIVITILSFKMLSPQQYRRSRINLILIISNHSPPSTPPPSSSHTTTQPYNFWVLSPSPHVGESFIPGGGLIQNEMRKIKKAQCLPVNQGLASPKSHTLKSWRECTRLIYAFQSTTEWRAPIRNHYLSTGVLLLFWQPAIMPRLIQRPSC